MKIQFVEHINLKNEIINGSKMFEWEKNILKYKMHKIKENGKN
jgi:hypothetical protein